MDPLQYWLIVTFTLGGGLFAIAAAWKDWDFFMNHRKARPLIKVVGRTGARWFYAAVGLILSAIGLGVLVLGPAAMGF